jgi:hypothetical protein
MRPCCSSNLASALCASSRQPHRYLVFVATRSKCPAQPCGPCHVWMRGGCVIVDQDLSHQAKGYRQKMPPVLGVKGALVDKSQMSLMDQGCALKSMSGTHALKMVPGNIAQVLVNRRNQLLERPLVPGFPAHQKLGYRLGRWLRHRQLGRKRLVRKDSLALLSSQCLQKGVRPR